MLGVGNELNGDDGAGVWVVRGLKRRLDERSDLLLVEAGLAPENFTSILRRFDPDWVLWIDTADLGLVPGAIKWLEWDETTGFNASTHTLSPGLLGRYLERELSCRMGILAIQPLHVRFGEKMSEPVKRSVNRLVKLLIGLLAGGELHTNVLE